MIGLSRREIKEKEMERGKEREMLKETRSLREVERVTAHHPVLRPMGRGFLQASAVNRALLALVVANCDSTSRNAVRKLQIQMQSRASTIILERKSKR